MNPEENRRRLQQILDFARIGMASSPRQIVEAHSLSQTLWLETFFTHEAAAMLLKMPNTYWFWRIIGTAVLRQYWLAGDNTSFIGRRAVMSAISQESDDMMRRLGWQRAAEDCSVLDRCAFLEAQLVGAILSLPSGAAVVNPILTLKTSS